jgi:hypothetical protein
MTEKKKKWPDKEEIEKRLKFKPSEETKPLPWRTWLFLEALYEKNDPTPEGRAKMAKTKETILIKRQIVRIFSEMRRRWLRTSANTEMFVIKTPNKTRRGREYENRPVS